VIDDEEWDERPTSNSGVRKAAVIYNSAGVHRIATPLDRSTFNSDPTCLSPTTTSSNPTSILEHDEDLQTAMRVGKHNRGKVPGGREGQQDEEEVPGA
jgi:hypothetical protein